MRHLSKMSIADSRLLFDLAPSVIVQKSEYHAAGEMLGFQSLLELYPIPQQSSDAVPHLRHLANGFSVAYLNFFRWVYLAAIMPRSQ